MQFSSALASGGDPSSMVDRVCERLARVDADSALGIVYMTDALAGDAEGIVERLRLGTGITSWCGGTGLGVCSTGQEVFGEPALSVLVCPLPKDSFCVFGPEDTNEPAAVREQWLDTHAPAVTLVHADPRHPMAMQTVESLAQRSFLVGGLLSSRGRYAHVAERIGEGAASGVMLDAGVAIATQLTQGCSPIGPRRLVTRADEQMLLELDHRPAMDALAEDLVSAGAVSTTSDLHVAIVVPGDDSGDYLVRNLLGASREDGALLVGERMEVGQSVMFCRRDEASARSDLERMLGTLSRRLREPPRAGIYVSCLARGPNLFSDAGEETRIIQQHLGEFPLTGFFANGELARDRIYAYTGVLTLFT